MIELERVTVCLGSGGVGKTTVAAALALALARRGERVVVLTIDPARRLADALGLQSRLGNEPSLVRRWDDTGGELWATMLDPAETFRNVVRTESSSDEQAQSIMANTLFTNLVTSLSGTNEYMAAERLHQLHSDERFDRVVVDTPPSRHGIDFLESPGRLYRFVNHRLYRSVFAPTTSLLRTVSAGGQMILRLLGRIVGSRLVDDVITFFANFQGLDQGFRRRAEAIEEVLNTETSFILVASPRAQPLEEARWIADRLKPPLSVVVMNRLCPVDATRAEIDGDVDRSDADPLVRNLQELAALAVQERQLIDDFLADLNRRSTDADASCLWIWEQATPVSDFDDIERISDVLADSIAGIGGPEGPAGG